MRTRILNLWGVLLSTAIALPLFTTSVHAGLEDERMSMHQKREAKRQARFLSRQDKDMTRQQRRAIADRHNDDKDRAIEENLVRMELAFDEMMPNMAPPMMPPVDPMMAPPAMVPPLPLGAVDVIIAKINRATGLIALSHNVKSSTVQAARHRLEAKINLIKAALGGANEDPAALSDGEETDYEDEDDITNDVLAMEGGAVNAGPYPGPYGAPYPGPYPAPGMYPAGYPGAYPAAPAPGMCPAGCMCPLHNMAGPAPVPAPGEAAPVPGCPAGCGCPLHNVAAPAPVPAPGEPAPVPGDPNAPVNG